MDATSRRRALIPVLIAVLSAGCGGVGTTADEATAARGVPGAAGDSRLVADGRGLYGATCAACQGADLEGTDGGPPFLDPIYAPDHHPDGAFYAAAELGVQAHHWEFGPMPPQPVDTDQLRAIIAYVRAVQRAEGIAP